MQTTEKIARKSAHRKSQNNCRKQNSLEKRPKIPQKKGLKNPWKYISRKSQKKISQYGHPNVSHYEKGFDERKYWAYGCNCLILGDRPMSEMGKGKPVDELDVACKEYKSCQKCVRMEFGPVNIYERDFIERIFFGKMLTNYGTFSSLFNSSKFVKSFIVFF